LEEVETVARTMAIMTSHASHALKRIVMVDMSFC
jgi:hypothetical protein